MTELAITAVGRDRPGIVAAFTESLFAIGANLQDCRAALLRGSFAMVMAVTVPDGVDADTVRAALGPVAGEMGLTVWLGATSPDDASATAGQCTVSVYGADHPGIVSAVTRALAGLGVNIDDLSSRLIGTPAVYVLGITCGLPAGVTPDDVRTTLTPVARAQSIEVSVSSPDDEIL